MAIKSRCIQIAVDLARQGVAPKTLSIADFMQDPDMLVATINAAKVYTEICGFLQTLRVKIMDGVELVWPSQDPRRQQLSLIDYAISTGTIPLPVFIKLLSLGVRPCVAYDLQDVCGLEAGLRSCKLNNVFIVCPTGQNVN